MQVQPSMAKGTVFGRPIWAALQVWQGSYLQQAHLGCVSNAVCRIEMLGCIAGATKHGEGALCGGVCVLLG